MSRNPTSPTRRAQALARRRSRALRIGAGGALLVAAVATATVTAIGSGDSAGEQRAAQTAAPKILAPADGSLRAAGVQVAQMPGLCDGSSCYYVPPRTPPQVTAGPNAKIALKAGVSKRFTATVFDLARPAATVPYRITDTGLELLKAPRGHYQVTVTGEPKGGSWMFEVTVR